MPLNYGDPLASYSQPDAPLAMRMMENLPGITASIGFSSMRGSNTLIAGGFFDDTTRFLKSRSKFGIFQGGSLTPTSATANSFAFGKRRFANKSFAGKDPFLKASRLNNITMRPRALTRMHSLSTFTAAQGSGLYTFAQGHRLLNKLPMNTLRSAIGAPEGAAIFGPGLISSIAAGRKLDRLGSKVGINQLELNLRRLATANNPALFKPPLIASGSIGGAGVPIYGASSVMDTGLAAMRAGEKGVAGNLMASAMGGQGTRYLSGYFRGAQGFAKTAGLMDDSLRGATTAVKHLSEALGGNKMRVAQKALSEGVFKTLGTKRVLQASMTSTGARVLGARAAALAIPGLQVVAAASLVYDLGRMGGEVIKSGINLARDASASIQGSINKPMFGMGYRDTELAATSRSRGVMAIQNSRLNARSVLGSEASMMAAHFG